MVTEPKFLEQSQTSWKFSTTCLQQLLIENSAVMQSNFPIT
jgi:hypothetical protein